MKTFTGGMMLTAVAAMYAFADLSAAAFGFLIFVSVVGAVLIVDDP